MNKTILSTAFIFGFAAVALGAFGSHALSDLLAPKALDAFKTGIYYQMIHTLLLLIIGISVNRFTLKQQQLLFYLLVFGILLFSGSIYAYYLLPLIGIEWSFLVYITPLGGVLFLIAWFLAAFYTLKTTTYG